MHAKWIRNLDEEENYLWLDYLKKKKLLEKSLQK